MQVSVTHKRLYLVAIIAQLTAPTMKDLARITGYPEPTIVHLFKDIKVDLDVVIEFVRTEGGHVSSGFYEIKDWGVINEATLLKKFPYYSQKMRSI